MQKKAPPKRGKWVMLLWRGPCPAISIMPGESECSAQTKRSSLRLFPKRRPAWDDAVQHRDIHGKQRDRRHEGIGKYLLIAHMQPSQRGNQSR
jgi:hypothetical protein